MKPSNLLFPNLVSKFEERTGAFLTELARGRMSLLAFLNKPRPPKATRTSPSPPGPGDRAVSPWHHHITHGTSVHGQKGQGQEPSPEDILEQITAVSG